jgi:ribosome recycling factor
MITYIGNQMLEEIYTETNSKMLAAKLSLTNNFDKIRTGRVNLKLFESIIVNCYEKSLSLNQLSTIIILNNNSVKITPWDKNNIQDINKAILNSNMGVNPTIDEGSLKINFPPMNTERRNELIKQTTKLTEDSKISIRNIRRDKNNIVKQLLKNKEITKDEEKFTQEKIQKITNKFILEVDECFKAKEVELMQI